MTMIHPYSRKLDNLDLVEHFLSVVLRHEKSGESDLLNKIISGEANLKNYSQSESTLSSTAQRNRDYRETSKRWKLRSQIVSELSTLQRLKEDDNIQLGAGGALPLSELKCDREAIIVIGLPASGKSGVANRIADEYGAVILDSDFAKRKLPEFNDNPAGASLVHEESDTLVFSCDANDKPDDFRTVFEVCESRGYNIVIPKIGHNEKSIEKLAQALTTCGYTSHLVLVSLDRRLATIRAVNRFITSGRYVPLSLIFDGYANDPILTFYRLKHSSSSISTFGKLSTDVEKGKDPVVLLKDDESPVCIFQSNLIY